MCLEVGSHPSHFSFVFEPLVHRSDTDLIRSGYGVDTERIRSGWLSGERCNGRGGSAIENDSLRLGVKAMA